MITSEATPVGTRFGFLSEEESIMVGGRSSSRRTRDIVADRSWTV